MTGLGKVLAVLFAVAVIGYFVLNAHDKANPVQDSGLTVDGKHVRAPAKAALHTPANDKEIREQKKSDKGVVPAKQKAQETLRLKPRLPRKTNSPRPFIHSSKSGIMDPLPPQRVPLPRLKPSQKDAGSK